MSFESYDKLLASAVWSHGLSSLNDELCRALTHVGAETRLNGNLLYRHLHPGFPDCELDPEIDDKRRNFFRLAKLGKTLVEIGVNGGHSLLLAKLANPELKCFGIDIAAQVDPTWARVDVYVPAAMQWLKDRFPGDFEFAIGDSRIEAPRLAVDRPGFRVDILHVDGDKETYLRDIINLLPLLHENSVIVVDDSNLGTVRSCIARLLRSGIAELHPDYQMPRRQTYRHKVLRLRRSGAVSYARAFVDSLRRNM